MNCNFIFKISTLMCMALGASLVSPIFWIKYNQFTSQILTLIKDRTDIETQHVDANCTTEWSDWKCNDKTIDNVDHCTVDLYRQRGDSACNVQNEWMPFEYIHNFSKEELTKPECLQNFATQIQNSPFAIWIVEESKRDCSVTTTTTEAPSTTTTEAPSKTTTTTKAP